MDTSVLVGYLIGRLGALELVRPWIANREVGTSTLVFAETVEYVKGRADALDRYTQLRRLLREIRPIGLTYSVLERYADLRRAFRPPHGPGLIGDIDTFIAATAFERNLIVVTTDADFTRVPGLAVMLLDRQRLSASPRRQS